MSTTVTVSIGRNIGRTFDFPSSYEVGDALNDAMWAKFKSEVTDLLAFDGGIHFLGEGVGYFEGDTEQSYTVVATVDNPVGLYHRLADLAPLFGQESIALTTGSTSFPGSE